MKTNFGRIFHYIKPHIKKHWISCFFIFFGYLLGVVFDSLVRPYMYKEIIDAFSSGASVEIIVATVTHLAIILAVVIVLYNIGYRIGDYANSYLQSKVMEELNNASFARILTHSYNFFSNNFSGGLVAKMKRFSKSFETLADIITFQILFSIISLFGIILILAFQAPVLAYVFLVWAIVYIIMTLLFIKRKIKYDMLEAEADSHMTGSLADAITNVLSIKIFSAERKEQAHYEKVTADEEIKRRRAWFFGNFQSTMQACLMAILQIVVVFVAINLWSRGLLSVGTIVLLQLYMFNLFDILWNLGRSLTKAIKALTDMKEVVDIFDLAIDIEDPRRPLRAETKKGEVVFTDVSFVYPGGVTVFQHLNLTIAPGERIGLVGHSGAGKSTVTKLLLRFLDVTGGAIMIDGQNIRDLTQHDVRSIISYVPQESMLFHRSIRENIAYGRPGASLKEIKEVAQKAYADEFIIRLPKGYDTLVGERGVKLSGGERQRVAIARAMLKNAPILVLDEATSSLDSVSEGYIQDAFTELMKGKTTIVIAHRLSTIQKMDRIVVLENGTIVEMGTHTDLLAKNGVYATMWSHQSGGFIEE